MPYGIKHVGDKYCVYNKETGESRGCSDTLDMANKHIAAMYANEKCLDLPQCQCGTCLAIRKDYSDIDGLSVEDVITAAVERIKAWFKSPTNDGSMITSVKQADGRTRVFMRTSNMFKDRHDEIITSEAHKEYEQYVASSKDYPELWLWHTPGSRWGQADLVSFDDGFLTVSGLVDQGKEYIVDGLGSYKGDLGVSHGFKGISIQGKGYIDFYRTFEVSPLPRQEAANIWTAVMIAEERTKAMGLQDKHKKFFETLHVPTEVIAGWDASNKDLSSLLKDAGIEYKEIDEDQATPPAAVIPVAATTPVAVAEAPNGSTSATLDDVLNAVKALASKVELVETAQKGFDKAQKDLLASAMQAELVPGRGFVASKEGDPPSETEKKETDDWLLDLITSGGARN